MPSNYKEVKIKNLSDFLKNVKAFQKSKEKRDVLWFRGHCSNKFELQPSIYRQPFDPLNEQWLINRFKSRAIPYLDRLPYPEKNEWEWLFLMQHFKLPTRLLDWSESSLIALAFAVMYRDHDHPKIKNTGAHIWCLDPISLNTIDFGNICKENDLIPNIKEDNSIGDIFWPGDNSKAEQKAMAIYGPQNNKRISGQKGVFTIFPKTDIFKLEDKIPKGVSLKMIIENDDEVRQIENDLYLYGITESVVYPELDSVSKELAREYKLFFSNAINKKKNVRSKKG